MLYKVAPFLPLVLPVVTGSLVPLIADINADAVVNLTSNISLSRRALAPTINFDDSNWIWTGEQAVGVRPFRKTVPSSNGTSPVCATIIISSDDPYSIIVNGAEVGSSSVSGSNSSAVYTAGLSSGGTDVFAIAVNNTGENAGFIAAILVDYTDGTMETLVTDSTWKTLQAAPPGGWTSPGFNDSAWIEAVSEEAASRGTPPLPPALNMTGVSWIRTNETDSSGVDPIGHRPFRKTVTLPYGKAAVCGKVVITADDAYTVYINGDSVGSSDIGWQSMQAYSIPMLDTAVNPIVIAVDSYNIEPSFAGLIAGVLLAYNDGTSETLYTDDSWKTLTESTPDGFEVTGLDDSAWINATEFIHPDSESVTVPLA
ncbi:hypothetical protein EV421DRAFT_1906523 [Armillaria borealis]|uniref:Uncharacterized protein n=1 Tax=Armillaria borealis TaxID=47425 RepID=A0AA39JA99_9AGAR|nr:hypothetical protein EV421DRAFT_1906523 [Armillaria borealis]